MARVACVHDRSEAHLPSRLEWLRATPSWAISAGLHLVVLIIFLSIVIETKKPEVKFGTTIVRIPIAARPEATPAPYDPLKRRAMEARPALPVPLADVTAAFVRATVDEEPSLAPKGSPNAPGDRDIADFDPQNAGLSYTIGPSVGAMSTQGVPLGENGRAAGRLTAPPPTENAVCAALEWLRRHQAPDGGWKSRDFTERCATTCRNAEPSRHGDGRGLAGHDVGVTGLAVLAFTGWGHTHRAGEHAELRDCVRRAMVYLKSAQVRSDDPSTNGRFGPGTTEQWTYDHAIATLAMSELCLMENDALLRNNVTDAVRLCLRAQNDGLGWRYGVRPGDNDTSVTGWMVLALKTARQARLDIPDADFERALNGAMHWLERATSAGGKTGYVAPGDDGSMLAAVFPDPYPYSKDLSCMTAVGVLCRLFAGESRSSAVVRKGVKLLAQHLPKWQEEHGRSLSTINFYYWYYGANAMFQFGGPDWTRWDEAMRAALLVTQRKGAQSCEDGSWDPIDEWGPAGGRVYATALGAMTLEVYYRFERAQEAGAKPK